MKTGTYEAASVIIDEFIGNNYISKSKYKIKKRPNKDGKYIVDFGKAGYIELSPNATSFTNDIFVIEFCKTLVIKNNQNITNLVGAPESIMQLSIDNCSNFKSFEGLPNFLAKPNEVTVLELIRMNNITDLMSLNEYINIPESIRLNINQCNSFKSLKGCPEKLHKLEITMCNSLTDLSYAPTTCNGIRISSCDSFKSLKGCPENLGDGKWYSGLNIAYCDNLTSFEGSPKNINGNIDVRNCEGLTSLKGLPKHIKQFYGSNLGVSSLYGAPESVDNDFTLDSCDNLTSLEGCPKKVGGEFAITRCHNIDVTEDNIKLLCDANKFYLWANGK